MENDEPLLTIGELARRVGVPVRTIRFWSDSGLVPPASRTDGARRLYDAACVARLELVTTLRELGVRPAGPLRRICRTTPRPSRSKPGSSSPRW